PPWHQDRRNGDLPSDHGQRCRTSEGLNRLTFSRKTIKLYEMKTREIADFLRGEVTGNADAEINAVADFARASTGEVAFLEKVDVETKTGASCVIVPAGFSGQLPCPTIKVKNPKLAFAKIAAILHPPKQREAEIHHSAVIADSA